MNFKFNEEEQEILDMLDDFAKNEVGPMAAEIDEEEKFPEDAWHQLAVLSDLHRCLREACILLRYNICSGICTYFSLQLADLCVRYRRAEAEIPGTACKRLLN